MVLLSVIARWVLSLIEKYSLIPAQLMEACSCRSINIALNFVLQQNYSSLQNKDGVATLQSLNTTEASNSIVLAQLLDNMRKGKASDLIAKWVGDLIRNITTTLYLSSYNTDTFLTHGYLLRLTTVAHLFLHL